MNKLSNYIVDSLKDTIPNTLNELFNYNDIITEDTRIQHAEDIIF